MDRMWPLPFLPFQDRGSQQRPETHCQQGTCLRALSSQEKQRVSFPHVRMGQEAAKRLLVMSDLGSGLIQRLTREDVYLSSKWRNLSHSLSPSVKDICWLLQNWGSLLGIWRCLLYSEGWNSAGEKLIVPNFLGPKIKTQFFRVNF